METYTDNENGRRAFWKERMDSAYEFMLEIQRYPVAECLEPLVSLPDAARSAGARVLFSPLPHVKGLPRLFFLREGLIADFIATAKEMNGHGWALKVEDGYRTREMQKHNAIRPDVFPAVLAKTRWEIGGGLPSVDLFRRRLAALIAMNPRVGTHCCGSAIDISVWDIQGAIEVDRGAPYLEVSEKTPMDSPFVSEDAMKNRKEITELMARHGFRTYPFEFWHYNKGDAYDEHLSGSGRPARYGPVDLDPSTGKVTPIAHPELPLNSEGEIAAMVGQAMQARSGV